MLASRPGSYWPSLGSSPCCVRSLTCRSLPVIEHPSFTVLIYLIALTVAAVSHQEDDAGVWHASVRFFPWFQIRSSLGSAPPSPTRNWQRPFALAAPQPKRPVKQADLRMSPDIEAAQEIEQPAPSMFVMSQSGANIVPVTVRQPVPEASVTARQASFPPPPF